MSQNPHDNTLLYAKSIPRTMPMLPQNPKHARIDMIITYMGHKQSRGIELFLPPEEIRAILGRLEKFLSEEARFYNTKAAIDKRAAQL